MKVNTEYIEDIYILIFLVYSLFLHTYVFFVVGKSIMLHIDIYVHMYKYIDLGYLGQIVSSKAQFVLQSPGFVTSGQKYKKKVLGYSSRHELILFFSPVISVFFVYLLSLKNSYGNF